MSDFRRRWLWLVVCLNWGILWSSAQQTGQSRELRPGPRDPAELEAFMDGVFAAQKEAHHLAGAVVTVVRDGQLFFSKGYGYADHDAKKPVDPARTLFRIGSVSKLFTWTAVMQLVEQGQLDLAADVNSYLAGSPVAVPATYSQPVTLTHLLTHTPGFEESVLGLFARNSGQLRSLEQVLVEEMPARVRPPGELASYSNHGTALAGYIVSRVSGLSFDDYIERRILTPLGMTHATARQPLPEALADDMSKGYVYEDGKFVAKDFEYVPAAPAGSMSAAGGSMALFMLAHLQDGALGEARILSDETTRLMHSRLFSHDPRLNAMLHGFYESRTKDPRIYGHGGDTLYFHTALLLIPEDRTGLFVSFNSADAADARSEMVEAFLERYYPPPANDLLPIPSPENADEIRRLAGHYGVTRVSHRSLAKIAGLVVVARIDVEGDGHLTLSGTFGPKRRFVQTEPLVFRQVGDDDEKLVFRTNDRGEATHFFIDGGPMVAFERLSSFRSPAFQWTVFGASLLVLLSALVLWPLGAFYRRGMTPIHRTLPSPFLPTALGWMTALTLTVFLVGFFVQLSDPNELVFGVPSALRLLLWLPLIAVLLAAAVFLFAAVSWRRGYWTMAGRIHYSLLAVACTTLLCWLYYWNLLGFHY